MGDGREGLDSFAADFLGGRVVGDQVRVLRLNDFEAAVELIVLGVREEGCVLVVVGAAGGANLICQLRVLGTQGFGNLRSVFCGVFCGALCSSLGGGSLLGGVVLSHPSSLAFLLRLSPITRHIARVPPAQTLAQEYRSYFPDCAPLFFNADTVHPRLLQVLARAPEEGGGESQGMKFRLRQRQQQSR